MFGLQRYAAIICVLGFAWQARSQELSPTNDFVICLDARLKTGQFRKIDTNLATIKLLTACSKEWKSASESCVEKGAQNGLTKGDCDVRTGLIAAIAVNLLNNEDGKNWDDFAERENKRLAQLAGQLPHPTYAPLPGSVRIEQGLLKVDRNYADQPIMILNSTMSRLQSVEVECGFFRGKDLLATERNIAEEIGANETAYITVLSSQSPGATSAKCRIVKFR